MPNPLFDRLLAPHLDREAPFLHLPDGRDLGYRDFLALAARQANALRTLGLAPGDRLAVQVEKTPEALALFPACVMSGIVLLPLNTAYTASEVAYFVTDSEAAAVICDPAAAPALASVHDRVLTLDADGGGSFADAAAAEPGHIDAVPREEDDLAALLYTSGTTGRAKGAMLTHRNLLSNATTLAEAWRFGPADVLLHALPIFHAHGLFVATNTVLASGGAMILQPRFDLDAVIAALPRATAMMGVPTFYTRLLGDPRLDAGLTRRVRLFISGSAPLLAETHVAFEARTGHRILERYGLTETTMNTSNPYEGERRPGTVGLPLPGIQVRVTADGAPLPAGEIGGVEVRGPNVFRGYWRMPDKTRAEFRDDGFFMTGDLGRFDAEGYLHLVGRSKDLIISGGYNVYPKEVELVLDEQPGVLESAVIGVPHPDFGEAVVAVLVPAPGAQPDLEAIRASVAAALARFKHPKRLVVVDELPRNTMGKVQKNLLRDRFADTFAASA